MPPNIMISGVRITVLDLDPKRFKTIKCDRSTWPARRKLTGQLPNQSGHCPLTGRHFEPCIHLAALMKNYAIRLSVPSWSNRDRFTYKTNILFYMFSNSIYVYTRGLLQCLLGFFLWAKTSFQLKLTLAILRRTQELKSVCANPGGPR